MSDVCGSERGKGERKETISHITNVHLFSSDLILHHASDRSKDQESL